MTNILSSDILARTHRSDWAETLREDMEDCLKEYSQLDLIVEVLQNALDAVDLRRYQLICSVANRTPHSNDTIRDWNSAVLECVQSDYVLYEPANEPVDRAQLYRQFANDAERRNQWWSVLSRHLGGSADELKLAAESFTPKLNLIVDLYSQPGWIEVEDNGVGIDDVINSFRHKVSSKRKYQNGLRRLGLRGSHGWGLTSLLALSNEVQVISKTDGKPPEAYIFANYAAFCAGEISEPQNQQVNLQDATESHKFSERLKGQEGETGTHVRLKLRDLDDSNSFGHTLKNYTHKKFVNFLRLYTPVGQVNDFLLHPAYHNIRKSDINITLKSLIGGKVEQSDVAFDVFRLSEQQGIPHYTYHEFVNQGQPSNVSVHTIHRTKKGGELCLSAAEIQSAKEIIGTLEGRLKSQEELPCYLDENDKEISEIPRGFYLALSGGMKAELLVRQPRSTSTAFRGFVLSETARPTLGRKHVMDQRRSIPKAASSHEQVYDSVRKAILPIAVAPTFSPRAARWRREFFDKVLEEIKSQKPISKDIKVWAGNESYEARVMLVFAELLTKGIFGDLYLLRVHLKDRYDFAFSYKCRAASDKTATVATLDSLYRAGYGEWQTLQREWFHRYGLGEFKANGESILDDFDPTNPRKASEALDLLVCWQFDEDMVSDLGWLVEKVTQTTREFENQTHLWRPTSNDIGRNRTLPVISLSELMNILVQQGVLSSSPNDWPNILPGNYF